jgi:hypothetical protein
VGGKAGEALVPVVVGVAIINPADTGSVERKHVIADVLVRGARP